MDQNRTSGLPPYGSSPGTSPTSHTTERLRDAAGDAADTARDAGRAVKEQAVSQARSLFEDRKGLATSQLGALGHALHTTASELDRDRQPLASVVHRAAERIDDLRDGLDRRDLDQIIHDTESLARRNPAIFLGGAVAIGFIAARFLKSSGHPRGLESNTREPDRFGNTRSPFVTYGEEL